MDTTVIFEISQDWEIAALRITVCVYPFIMEFYMNEKYMDVAIKEAEKAFAQDEVPVGAVIVKNDKIIARAHNTVEKYFCAINHAEINAIYKASKKNKNWRLVDCDLYVTLEPCEMCMSAIKKSRIKNVYYILSKNNDEHIQINVKKIINEEKKENVNNLLTDFFKEKRKKNDIIG